MVIIIGAVFVIIGVSFYIRSLLKSYDEYKKYGDDINNTPIIPSEKKKKRVYIEERTEFKNKEQEAKYREFQQTDEDYKKGYEEVEYDPDDDDLNAENYFYLKDENNKLRRDKDGKPIKVRYSTVVYVLGAILCFWGALNWWVDYTETKFYAKYGYMWDVPEEGNKFYDVLIEEASKVDKNLKIDGEKFDYPHKCKQGSTSTKIKTVYHAHNYLINNYKDKIVYPVYYKKLDSKYKKEPLIYVLFRDKLDGDLISVRIGYHPSYYKSKGKKSTYDSGYRINDNTNLIVPNFSKIINNSGTLYNSNFKFFDIPPLLPSPYDIKNAPRYYNKIKNEYDYINMIINLSNDLKLKVFGVLFFDKLPEKQLDYHSNVFRDTSGDFIHNTYKLIPKYFTSIAIPVENINDVTRETFIDYAKEFINRKNTLDSQILNKNNIKDSREEIFKNNPPFISYRFF